MCNKTSLVGLALAVYQAEGGYAGSKGELNERSDSPTRLGFDLKKASLLCLAIIGWQSGGSKGRSPKQSGYIYPLSGEAGLRCATNPVYTHRDWLLIKRQRLRLHGYRSQYPARLAYDVQQNQFSMSYIGWLSSERRLRFSLNHLNTYSVRLSIKTLQNCSSVKTILLQTTCISPDAIENSP